MRAREFIKEDIDGRTGSITYDVGRALPGAWKIPKLQNQDPYLQYRFGVAIAGAKGAKQRAQDGVPKFQDDNTFGENMVIVSYDPHTREYIDDALHSMGMPSSDAVQIGTLKSEEMPEVVKVSPVKAFKGYGR
jgi:hypothetical protein